MENLKTYREYGAELERRLRLKTFPVAIKLLEKEKDIPEGAKRPLKDFGHHFSLCQTLEMSRRDGKIMAMLKEDHWCFEPVVGYGLGEPPDYFLQGHNRYPKDVATLEAGKHYAEEFPRLEAGKYIGMASAPLPSTNFQPDVIMIYCDAAQLCLLLLGREYKDGRNLKCSISGHAACVYGVVPAVQSGECQMAVPCRGDHYRAMAGDEEMIFTVPAGKLEDLMLGLRAIEKTGSKLPVGYSFRPEYPLLDSYQKIGEMMGYLKKK
jgi:uncharacterized protein (DUF169 family)